MTFSHKLTPRTDALILVKRRRKLGPAKTKALSRGLPKGLEAVRMLLYIYSYTQAVRCPRERLPSLDSLTKSLTLKIREVKLLEAVVAV
ncbi:hypothetical protein TSAR_011742 [Trichomalopsis sarcophagae]|uniref:Uncharacterized protein n=1 Tax=Trichomalopsis sarcophagae TaxID=543379 RepID=A0A232EQT3_9HYME|nr:hypothetical protein TSAR_011742 [Trichomalopsis sarcophagae]